MTEAQIERESQRSESEARDIIHDIDRLNTFPENKKTRWVWELLQNAKDVATENGVDITYELKNDQFIFSHNGSAFETKHLLALLYKTSTKSLGSEDGTTGKYGTGFVTTHVLSEKLTIAGIHQKKDDSSFRKFTLEIDRTAANLCDEEALEGMKSSLSTTFQQIEKIIENPSSENHDLYHSFSYKLSDYSKKYANTGLEELEKNIPFVLLINRREKKHINSVTIIRDGVKQIFNINPIQSKINGLNYIAVANDSGILYRETESLIFGIPVLVEGEKYTIQSIDGRSVLFKEFPLIGSEYFHLPVFIQHKHFKPTEERDGIRTKKKHEDVENATADGNRKCLVEFISEYLKFISIVIDSSCKNIYHLALSGLPEFAEKYHNIDWYLENVQKPIRSLILEKPIVENVKGELILINDTKFPIPDLSNDEDFFSLLADLKPNCITSIESSKYWNIIINQQPENWAKEITISFEQLLETIPNCLDLLSDDVYQKLHKVYSFLEAKNSKLGELYPIYLNSKNQFKTRNEVSLYPLIDDEIKYVSKKLGRDLDDEFLNKNLGKVNDIKEFNLEEFYKALNTDFISPVKVEEATDCQIEAILHINTLFKSDRASKREHWLEIVKELLPTKINTRKIIPIEYESFHYPAELWTAKYVCWLIQNEETFDSFKETYFCNNEEVAYLWLDRFLSYIIQSRDDIKGFLTKYKIIPVQNGKFVYDSESIFREENSEYFDDFLKDIVTNNCKHDIRAQLVSNQLSLSEFRSTNVAIITDKIDNLFIDPNISDRVAKTGDLNYVFLEINNWFEKHSDASSYLKTFASKRNMLYVISLGDGFSKQIMALNKSGKSMEDIVELADITLSTSDMKELARLANELGTNELLKKAEEMVLLRDQRRKWKEIGDTAEKAFKEIFNNLDIEIELNNPDVGKDFEIVLKNRLFSIEIKNVIDGKENVRMSILQGKTAVQERDSYVLCVLTRPDNSSDITLEYFKHNARFVKDIGYQIGNKISNWEEGLNGLSLDSEIKVSLDERKESVYVNRSIWRNGISFQEFIVHLEHFFSIKLSENLRSDILQVSTFSSSDCKL